MAIRVRTRRAVELAVSLLVPRLLYKPRSAVRPLAPVPVPWAAAERITTPLTGHFAGLQGLRCGHSVGRTPPRFGALT
jgi:hypothetical protein